MLFSSGKITEYPFYSHELQEELTLLIYLPASYSPLYKYHLLIAQDGQDYFQLGRIGRWVDEQDEPIIVVGLPYVDIQDRWKKYHPNGELYRAYTRFLALELVPFLDQQFPTLHMGMGRTLIGDSLGGTVSLQAALLFPHTFGKVIMQSPFINEKLMEVVEDFAEPHLLSIYHVIGTKETEVKTTKNKTEDFLTPNRKISTVFQKKGFSYFYEEFEGDHTWTYWQPDLQRALKIMFSS